MMYLVNINFFFPILFGVNSLYKIIVNKVLQIDKDRTNQGFIIKDESHSSGLKK